MTHRPPPLRASRRGAILAVVLGCLLVASLLGLALIRLLVIQRRQARLLEQHQQCLWLADSAAQRALQRLARAADYPGESWSISAATLGGSQSGAVTIQVSPVTAPAAGQRIHVEARFPDDPIHRTVCHRELFVKRTLPGDSP